jgi:hypothetical protein
MKLEQTLENKMVSREIEHNKHDCRSVLAVFIFSGRQLSKEVLSLIYLKTAQFCLLNFVIKKLYDEVICGRVRRHSILLINPFKTVKSMYNRPIYMYIHIWLQPIVEGQSNVFPWERQAPGGRD